MEDVAYYGISPVFEGILSLITDFPDNIHEIFFQLAGVLEIIQIIPAGKHDFHLAVHGFVFLIQGTVVPVNAPQNIQNHVIIGIHVSAFQQIRFSKQPVNQGRRFPAVGKLKGAGQRIFILGKEIGIPAVGKLIFENPVPALQKPDINGIQAFFIGVVPIDTSGKRAACSHHHPGLKLDTAVIQDAFQIL